MSNSLGYPNKKCTFAYRVVRRSKSQNISALALSLNRYHKSVTPSFQSDTQSDISFLIIPCKDTKNKSSPQHHFFSKRIIMLCIWLIMSKIMLILPKKINIQFIYKNILNTYSLSYFVLCETFCNFAPEKQIL